MTNQTKILAACELVKQCSDPAEFECSSDVVQAFNLAKISLMYLVSVCQPNSDKESEL